jgi:hypothetical protein
VCVNYDRDESTERRIVDCTMRQMEPSVAEDNGGAKRLEGAANLTRSERRSWKLHCQLAQHLTRSTLAQWQHTIERNLRTLRAGVTGQPHMRSLDRWESLVKQRDVPGLRRVLTGLDRDCIEMREVSPMGGLLPEDARMRALGEAMPAKTGTRRFGQLPQLMVPDGFDESLADPEIDAGESNPPP